MADDASAIASATPASGPIRRRWRTSRSPTSSHFTSDTHWPWFERLRRGPGPLQRRERIRPLLVGDQVPGHRRGGFNHEVFSSDSELRRHHRSPTHCEPSDRRPASSRSTRPTTTPSARWSRRCSPRPAWPSMEPLIRERAGDDPRRAAGRRDLRLRRQGLRRTHQPDAGHPVRLPVRAAPHPAAALRPAALRPAAADMTLEEMTQRQAEMFMPLVMPFIGLWNARMDGPPANDLISLLATTRRPARATGPRAISATSSC